MDGISTPKNRVPSRLDTLVSGSRTKRDIAAAGLPTDPQSSTAKRQQRTQAFSSQMAHSSLERQLLAAQSAKAELEKKLRERDIKIEGLEKDRRWLAEREKEEREEKEREREEHDAAKLKSDSDYRALRNAHTALREEHADLQDSSESSSRQSANTIASLQSTLNARTREVDGLQTELAETKRVSAERSDALHALQLELDDLNAAQDVSIHQEAEQENWSVVREELQRQADYLRQLEATNARMNSELLNLRGRHASIEVLREEKRGLETKLQRMDQLRDMVTRLEAEVEAGRREREEWASKAASDSRSISTTSSLSSLRLTNAKLLEENGVASALLRSREAEMADMAERDQQSRDTIQSLQTEVSRLRDSVARRGTRAVLAEREAGFLQALNASYVEENQDGAGLVDAAKEQHLRELEGLLSEYKEIITKYEAEISSFGEDVSTIGQGQSRQQLSEELAAERNAVLEVKKALEESTAETIEYLVKIEQLEQSLFELGGEIAGGRHIPPGIRVLAMKESPDQQWLDLRQAAMDRLRGENEALLNRLRDLESSGAVAAGGSQQNMVPRESYEHLEVANKELEEEVKQKEKSRKRLQEIYTNKAAEFRETISNLLGLKLAFYQNGQIRVTSIYDLNASFVFQPPKGQETRVQLVGQGENGSEELEDALQYWIGEEQCIPGFLASISLQCYDKAKTDGTLPG